MLKKRIEAGKRAAKAFLLIGVIRCLHWFCDDWTMQSVANVLQDPPTLSAAISRKLWLPVVLLLFLLSGCVTKQPPPAVLDERNIDKSLPMIALEAYRADDSFYLKYRLGERVFYAGATWLEPLQSVLEEEPETKHYGEPTMVPIQYRQLEPWESLPTGLTELPIIPVHQWREMRNRLLRSLVPNNGEGVILDFGYAEYFLYYDKNNQFHATRVQDKPSNYSIGRVLRFDEFVELSKPVMQKFLQDYRITSTELFFNTGDTGLYSLPFFYANTSEHLYTFLRNAPLVPVAVSGTSAGQEGQAVAHMTKSHLTNLLVRPISSLYRLFFALTDTAVSTVTFDWATGLTNSDIPPLSKTSPMDLALWEQELDKIAPNSSTTGTVEFLIDGEQFFPRFLDQVSRAEQSVRLQTYIFDNDDYAVTVGDMLKRRSNEGIDVKVLLDGFGTIFGTMAEAESLPADHLPPSSVKRFLEQDSTVQVRQKSNPWFTGDHVKSTVIDDKVAYIGGMNIGREYRYDWHDLMMELNGPIVGKITREFDVAWAHAGPLGDLGYLVEKGKLEKRDDSEAGKPLRVLTTRPGNYQIFKAQVKATRQAKSYIYVQNAYFTDDTLLRELVLARRRGVDVRVIIPMETDHGPITRSNVLAANFMLKHGIRVYIYPGFSHVKAAIYDGWVCAGSANFDRLSLRINRELNLASSDPDIAERLKTEVFEADFERSPELTEPVPERWADHLVEMIGDFVY